MTVETEKGAADSGYQAYLALAKFYGWIVKSYDEWLNHRSYI